MPAVVFGYGRYRGNVYQPSVRRTEDNGKTKMQVIVALVRKVVVMA